MEELISLDLENSVLMAFQDHVFDSIIYSMIVGIGEKDTFPPVPVCKIDGVYYLTNIPEDWRYQTLGEAEVLIGGTHRAFAHKKANMPLICELRQDDIRSKKTYHDLSCIELVEDKDLIVFRQFSSDGHYYRPISDIKRPVDWDAILKKAA